MITDKRLQEIKEALDNTRRLFNFDSQPKERVQMFHDMKELIAAYENQGELLQLALGNTDKAQAELVDAVEMLAEEGFYVTDEKGLEYVTLRKQLACLLEREKRMQAEHSISMDNYEKQLAKPHDNALVVSRDRYKENAYLCNKLTEEHDKFLAMKNDLRKQLAEAQAQVEYWKHQPMVWEETVGSKQRR